MPLTPEVLNKMSDLRSQSGKTYRQIADECNSSEANVRRYFTGETKTPDMELLRDMIQCVGGDPADVLDGAPKPEPQTATPAPGNPYELYDRMLQAMDARWQRQEQRHSTHLERCDNKHREDVANLKEAHQETIKSKDAWIERIKGERDQLKQDLDEARSAQRTLRLVVTILSVVVAVLACVFVLPDLLDGSWGFFQY